MELRDISYYIDSSNFRHRELFDSLAYVYDFLKRIPEYIATCPQPKILGTVMPGAFIGDNVHLGKGSVVQPGAWVMGPALIGENCEIRHGAFVGANVITGDRVIIGHASEVGNSVFLDNARAPHFAFVGHSILGNRVNLGAGTKLSNLKLSFGNITLGGQDTGLQKFGAIIGDDSSLGCNTVTQPASLIGKNVFGYPLALIRGFVPSNKVIKIRQTQETVEFMREFK